MHSTVQEKAFLLLLVAVSLALAWILSPVAGAILWATIFAILFAPLNRRLTRTLKRTPAALATTLIVIVLVIVPLLLLGNSLIDEGLSISKMIRSGELDFGAYLQRVFDQLPESFIRMLAHFELTDPPAVEQRLNAMAMKAGQYLGAQAVSIGQNSLSVFFALLVMLNLLYFFLRDGDPLSTRIQNALPLRAEQQVAFVTKFAVVIRATVTGNIILALMRGAFGAVVFWLLDIRAPLLWGAIMALFSLLPLVGPALVWLPVAIYLLSVGMIWRSIFLIVSCTVATSLAVGIMRPILVSKTVQVPDHLVLLSTIGGLAIFGISGFVVGPLIAAMFVTAWEIAGKDLVGKDIAGKYPVGKDRER
jgi:predicted PurR-regulated permease PerM